MARSIPTVAKYLIEGAITGWCNDHLDTFSHVFATVEINTKIDTWRRVMLLRRVTSHGDPDSRPGARDAIRAYSA